MEITTQELNDVELITVRGRLDSVEAPRLAQAFETASERGKHRIVIDMSDLEYMSSAGFRALGNAQRNSKRHHGEVVLVQVPNLIHEALELVGFAASFKTFDDVKSAAKFVASLPTGDSNADAPPPGE